MTRRLLGCAWLLLMLCSSAVMADLSNRDALGPAFVAYLVGIVALSNALCSFRAAREDSE